MRDGQDLIRRDVSTRLSDRMLHLARTFRCYILRVRVMANVGKQPRRAQRGDEK